MRRPKRPQPATQSIARPALRCGMLRDASCKGGHASEDPGMSRVDDVRQRLSDLRQAVQRGEMTEAAYEAARERLLAGMTPQERAEAEGGAGRVPRPAAGSPVPRPSAGPASMRFEPPSIPRPSLTGSAPPPSRGPDADSL